MNAVGVTISGVGHYAPERILTNEDLERTLDTSDEWITTRTGMKRRHIAAPEQAVSDLAVIAAQNALDHAHLKATDIDCFIVATVTPDYIFPATACIVAARLGAPGKAAFDIEIACSGFIYGMTVAASYVRTGIFKRVMLIGAETLSKIVNRNDRGTAILFGDAAGAAIFEASVEDCFLSCELGADGSNPGVLFVPAGGSRKRLDADAIERGEGYMYMNGKEVFKFAVTKMMEASMAALKKANIEKADLSFMIPHQANKRIIDAAARFLELPPEKVIINIHEYGNTSAATIPVALSECVEKNLFKKDDILVFVGFGGGLSWGSVIWKWSGIGNGSVQGKAS